MSAPRQSSGTSKNASPADRVTRRSAALKATVIAEAAPRVTTLPSARATSRIWATAVA